MASLGLQALGQAGLRLLTALGITAAGGAAVDGAREVTRKRQEDADKAKTSPIAQTTTKAGEKCKDCPPDRGVPALQPTKGWSELSIAYQQRIAMMPPAPSGFLSEWSFNGVQFDGFDSTQCLLKEAKGRYDQFFDDFGVPRRWWEGEEPLIDEAMRQGAAARPRPPITLRWHFMQPLSYRYFSQIIQAAYPDVEVVFMP